MEEVSNTGWHWLGPWTGYYIGAALTIGVLWLNRKL
jgi:hypothetical protein